MNFDTLESANAWAQSLREIGYRTTIKVYPGGVFVVTAQNRKTRRAARWTF